MRAQFIENFPSLVVVNYTDESQRSSDKQHSIEIALILLAKNSAIIKLVY